MSGGLLTAQTVRFVFSKESAISECEFPRPSHFDYVLVMSTYFNYIPAFIPFLWEATVLVLDEDRISRLQLGQWARVLT